MWTYNRQRFRDVKGGLRNFETELKEQLLQRFYCTRRNELQFMNEDGDDIPPYACQFSSARVNDASTPCLIADEDGYVSIVDSGRYSCSTITTAKWRCHRNAIFDIAWAKGNTFATASGDTTAVLWDASVPEKQLNVFRGHSCSLKSICVSKFHPNLLATGSRDGNALIWDERCKSGENLTSQPVIRIQDAHAIHDALTPPKKMRRKACNQLLQDSRQTVTSVIFQADDTLITSGAMDGTIKLWDLRKIRSTSKTGKSGRGNCPTPKEYIPYPGTSSRRRGYTCLTIDSTHTRLFASCTDDTVYEYDLLDFVPGCSIIPVHRYTGHYSSSFYVKIKLSPDDLFLLSGCDDDKAYIWNTRSTTSVTSPSAYLCSDGMEQVTSVDWCSTDWTQLVTCSDDCCARFWKLSGEWPLPSSYDGFCKKLYSKPQKFSEADGLKSENEGQTNITPVKSSPIPFPLSPELHLLTPKQTSLCKWVQQKSSPWKTPKEGTTSSPNDANKENRETSTPRNLPRKFEPRRALISNSNVSPSNKVEFRSRKPYQRSSCSKRSTMEDYFL